jgi:trehalose 6-phosphate synthase
VLILSQFAGAAQQLKAALLVNPLKTDHAAAALAQALRMPSIEQAKRMAVLRATVQSFDASWWAEQMVHDASHVSPLPRRRAEDRRWSTAVA